MKGRGAIMSRHAPARELENEAAWESDGTNIPIRAAGHASNNRPELLIGDVPHHALPVADGTGIGHEHQLRLEPGNSGLQIPSGVLPTRTLAERADDFRDVHPTSRLWRCDQMGE